MVHCLSSLALPRSFWFLSCSILLGGLGGLRPPRSFPVFPSFFPASSLLPRVSSLLRLPSVLLSSSDLVPPCSPHGASVVLSQPCWFSSLALPRFCWFLSCSLLLGKTWPFPEPAGSFPVLSCLAASAASGRLGLSLFSPASSLLPHCSFMFPQCSACPLYFSLLLTWSLPVLLMLLEWSFPSLVGSLPVRPCFFPALYCHFFVLLCFVSIALLPCSFQVLLTPCLVKSC